MRRPWLVLLCKFSDQPQEPQPPDFFRRYIGAEGRGLGGAFDYFWDQSMGAADLTGTTVLGWLTMNHTLADDRALSRWDRIMRGIDAARGRVDFNQFDGILVILNAQVDSGSNGRATLNFDGRWKDYGLVVLDPLAWTTSWAGHEMGHGFGLPHSFAAGNPDVEYGDPWDIMSAFTFGGRSATFTGRNFGESGPALTTAYRERMGWLPEDRKVWHNQIGDASRPSIRLAPLANPAAAGALMLKVFTRAAYVDSFWSVEYRRRTGWDAGVGADKVIVHEVRPNGQAYFCAEIGNGERHDFGAANLVLSARDVNADGATVSVERPLPRQFYYDTAEGTLAPGATVRWWLWFGVLPTLLTVVPVPHTNDVPVGTGDLRSQRNADGTVTYWVDVTNHGAATATYHLAARLTV